MTTIQTNNGIPDDVLAAMNGTKKTTATSTADDAQNRFMTLLVTQMKNQDPLNPLDNAQITSQLAQLSTLNGINQLNTTLDALKGSYQASQTLQATSMIGHGVFVPGSDMSLSDGKAVFGADLASAADSVQITVRDAAGAVVHTSNMGAAQAGIIPMTWDGKTDSGVAAPDGTYTFEVRATASGNKVDATALSFGMVTSVSTSSSGLKLNTPGLGALNLSDVRQIL